jgi:hypothetical protein
VTAAVVWEYICRGRYCRGNCEGFTSKTYGERGLWCGENSWKGRGGIMKVEKDTVGGSAQNWRLKCLCDTKIWKGLQNITLTGVVAIFIKQEIIT